MSRWFPFAWSQRNKVLLLAFHCKREICLSVNHREITKEGIEIMTRPKKEKEMSRNQRITVRFTDTEFAIIENAAKQANLSLAAYVRTQTLKGNVHTKIEIVADVPEIKSLLAEVGKIGSNLNQIAKYFNQGGILSQEMRGEINKRLRDLYEMKYKVMEMAGDFRGNTETYRK